MFPLAQGLGKAQATGSWHYHGHPIRLGLADDEQTHRKPGSSWGLTSCFHISICPWRSSIGCYPFGPEWSHFTLKKKIYIYIFIFYLYLYLSIYINSSLRVRTKAEKSIKMILREGMSLGLSEWEPQTLWNFLWQIAKASVAVKSCSTVPSYRP